MAKKKLARPKKIFNPFLVSLAAATGWAAAQSSYAFSSFSMVAAWLISALSIGLIVRAALAVIIPLLKLGAEFVQYLFNPEHTNDRGGV